MRVLMTAEIPTESGNAAIRDGSMQQAVEKMLDGLKPEAAYFTTVSGHRGMFVVFDLDDVANIPPVVEQLFVSLGAEIDLKPVMNREDLFSGLRKLQG